MWKVRSFRTVAMSVNTVTDRLARRGFGASGPPAKVIGLSVRPTAAPNQILRHAASLLRK